LDEWAKANIWADKEAKAYLTAYVRMNCPALSTKKIKGQRWKLKVNGQGVTKNVNKAIYDEKWRRRGKQYWIKKWGLEHMKQYIDWTVFVKTGA